MSQTIISLIHCLQGKIDVTNVTHTWYLCFLCTTRGPHTQFLMAFSNYILQFYIWYELVHSFTSSQAKDKSCYREAKNTVLPKWKPENISNTIVYLLMFSGFNFGTSENGFSCKISFSKGEWIKFLKFCNENYFRIIIILLM